MTSNATLRLEDFIQAVQSQLDNAQSAMAMKARNLNLPLTFAIKDINLDLRAHVEFINSEIRIRPAGADEKEASVFHLVFTVITRPAIEENAVSFAEDPDDQSLEELDGDLTPDERKRLEWAGVRTVKQFQDAHDRGTVSTIGRVTNLPVERLRKALERASTPLVHRVEPVSLEEEDDQSGPPMIRISGRNLVRKGLFPKVRIDGKPVSILKSSPGELLISPTADQWSGELSVEAAPKSALAMSFDLTNFAPPPEMENLTEAAMPAAATAQYYGSSDVTIASPPKAELQS